MKTYRFIATPNSYYNKTGNLNPTAFMVLHRLSGLTFGRGKSHVDITQRDLASICGITTPTLSDAVAELKQCDWLTTSIVNRKTRYMLKIDESDRLTNRESPLDVRDTIDDCNQELYPTPDDEWVFVEPKFSSTVVELTVNGQYPEPEIPKVKIPKAAIAELENEFVELTRIPPPFRETANQRKAAAALWWNPIREIIQLANGDVDLAKWALRTAVNDLLDGNMTVTTPKSALQMARKELANA